MKQPSWPAVALALVGMMGIASVLGTLVWAVERGHVEGRDVVPGVVAFLLVVLGVATGYLRGLMKLPPAPPGKEWNLVPSISPPPSDDELAGKVPLPRTARPPHVVDVELYDTSAVTVVEDVDAKKGTP